MRIWDNVLLTAYMRLVSVSGQFVCFGRLFSLFGLFWAAGDLLFLCHSGPGLVLGNTESNHFNGESCKHPLSSDLNKSKSATEAGRGLGQGQPLPLLEGTCRMDDNTDGGRILANKLQRNGAHCTQCKRCLHRRQPPPWGVLLEMWLELGLGLGLGVDEATPRKSLTCSICMSPAVSSLKRYFAQKNFVHKAAAPNKGRQTT